MKTCTLLILKFSTCIAFFVMAIFMGGKHLLLHQATPPKLLSESIQIITPDSTYLTRIQFELNVGDILSDTSIDSGNRNLYGYVTMHAEALTDSEWGNENIEAYVEVSDPYLITLFESKCSNLKKVIKENELRRIFEMVGGGRDGDTGRSYFKIPIVSVRGGSKIIPPRNQCINPDSLTYASRIGNEIMLATPEIVWEQFGEFDGPKRVEKEEELRIQTIEAGRDEFGMIPPLLEFEDWPSENPRPRDWSYSFEIGSVLVTNLSHRYAEMNGNPDIEDKKIYVRAGAEKGSVERSSSEEIEYDDMSRGIPVSNDPIVVWLRDRLYDDDRDIYLLISSLFLGVALTSFIDFVVSALFALLSLKSYKRLAYGQLITVVRKYADGPIRTKGSHQIFKRKTDGRTFSFPVRSKDFKAQTVKKILTKDLGLNETQAREELGKE